MHVHVYHADGEAKFWLEPMVELAQNFGLDIDLHMDSVRHPERFPLVSRVSP